jgi:hypothetical protein
MGSVRFTVEGESERCVFFFTVSDERYKVGGTITTAHGALALFYYDVRSLYTTRS